MAHGNVLGKIVRVETRAVPKPNAVRSIARNLAKEFITEAVYDGAGYVLGMEKKTGKPTIGGAAYDASKGLKKRLTGPGGTPIPPERLVAVVNRENDLSEEQKREVMMTLQKEITMTNFMMSNSVYAQNAAVRLPNEKQETFMRSLEDKVFKDES